MTMNNEDQEWLRNLAGNDQQMAALSMFSKTLMFYFKALGEAGFQEHMAFALVRDFQKQSIANLKA